MTIYRGLLSKFKLSKLMAVSCVMMLLASVVSTNANANYTKRNGTWESTFKLINSQSASIDGKGGSSLDLKSDIGWGFTLGYNVNPHILVNFDFSSTTPSYKATVGKEDGLNVSTRHKMDLFESQFNVVYSFLTSNFTPYVQAGGGWSYIDSNIASGPPSSVCWWDPWYGYICDGYQNTYNDTRLSYNVAAGVRYELPNHMFFRASYKQSWINLSHSDDASIGSYHFEIGSMF